MKRLLPLFLALVLCFTLTGCLSREEQQNRKLALELVNGSSSADYALSTGASFEGRRIYEDNSGLIIYLAGIKGTPLSPELVLAVKNGTRYDLGMSVIGLTYNDWEANGWVDGYEIPSHSASIATVRCDDNFALLNLSDIHTVSALLTIYTMDDYDSVAETTISITLDNEDWVDDYQVTGIPLIESPDIDLVAESLKDVSGKAQLSLYANNHTNHTLRISSSNTTLNGDAVELFLWSSLSPNARRLLSEDIKEIDTFKSISIEPDDELCFHLQISDDDSLSVLDEVDVSLRGSDFLKLAEEAAQSAPDTTTDAPAVEPVEVPADEPTADAPDAADASTAESVSESAA